MRRILSPALLAFAFTLLALGLAQPTVAAPDLTGTWLLVEQTYGTGASNLVDALEPVRIRIERDAKGPQVRIWHGTQEAAASAWPALMAEGRELRSTSRSVAIDASGSTLSGRCRVVPVEGEELELDVRETYTLSADGRELRGTVEVAFVRPDGPHGGYTLQRKFERER